MTLRPLPILCGDHAVAPYRRVEDGIVVASYHAVKTELLNHNM